MASASYLIGRKRYQRPQGILWSENSGTLIDGLYVPNGYEVGTDTNETDESLLNQFIILSDHNRSELSFSPQRIEQRQRTINGRMRSYHIADKLNISEQSVNQLENNEAFETISLKSLRKLAEAIDCELHYAIIPRERSLQKIIQKRAEFKARLIIKEVNKTMELEDQKIENPENSVKLLTKDFTENLNKNLWRNDEN